MVQIANPIYDVVFKYLMKDDKVELEQLLALFDQSNMTSSDHHLLNIDEENLPERYRPLLRRLQMAVAEPNVRETMNAEDDLIEEIKDYQRKVLEKEKVITEQEKVISEKDQKLRDAIHALHSTGMGTEKIAGIFGMAQEEIKAILGD